MKPAWTLFVVAFYCIGGACFSLILRSKRESAVTERCMAIDEESDRTSQPFDPKDVHCFLWTRNTPVHKPEELFVGDPKSFKESSFAAYLPTKVAIHGFGSSTISPLITTLRAEYLKAEAVNYIAVDWSRAQVPLKYNATVGRTRPVGELVGEFVSFLVRNGADLRRIDILGYSLGAHVAGHAGRHLKQNRGMVLPRITGLDPAGPKFEFACNEERLDASNADFVDVIHTNAGGFGIVKPIGHVDFYPNRGSLQPGCLSKDVLITDSLLEIQLSTDCSHSRSWKYFAESINARVGFLAVRCGDVYENLRACKGQEMEVMGEHVSPTARGVFWLRTNDNSPFALGAKGI